MLVQQGLWGVISLPGFLIAIINACADYRCWGIKKGEFQCDFWKVTWQNANSSAIQIWNCNWHWLVFIIIGIGMFIRIAIGIDLFLLQLTLELSLEFFVLLNYLFELTLDLPLFSLNWNLNFDWTCHCLLIRIRIWIWLAIVFLWSGRETLSQWSLLWLNVNQHWIIVCSFLIYLTIECFLYYSNCNQLGTWIALIKWKD